MKYPKTFSAKYPKFIRNKLSPNQRIWKIFPRIGLRNSSAIINHKGKTYKVVFSSHPWDIATMSMRGIRSCQSWRGGYNKCLVGSIVDPCAAIIYIEDKKSNKYGKLMFARAVVRLVSTSNGRRLFLEPVYLGEKIIYDDSTCEVAEKIFYKYIRSVAKYPIGAKPMGYSEFRRFFSSAQIPLSKEVQDLSDGYLYDSPYLSYSDNKLTYTRKVLIKE
jgi:hypothetical protein